MKSLSDVAKKGKRSVVSLLVLTGATIGNKEFVSESQSVSGVLIADNGQELLILGPTMEVGETQQIQATFCDGKKISGYREEERCEPRTDDLRSEGITAGRKDGKEYPACSAWQFL